MNIAICLSAMWILVGAGYTSSNIDINDIKPEIQEQKEISYSEEDLRYLSSLIYAEAGNQCNAGKEAVGIIVINRSESKFFNNGIYEVIYESNQFTPTKNGMLNKSLDLYDNNLLPNSCVNAAIYALEGNKTVVYNEEIIDLSSCYYFSRYLENKKYRIQDHDFK